MANKMLHFKDREELNRYIEKTFAQFERKEWITVDDDGNPIDDDIDDIDDKDVPSLEEIKAYIASRNK